MTNRTNRNHQHQKINDTNRKYKKFNYPSSVPGGKTLLTGIRGVNNCHRPETEKVYITGFYEPASDQPDQEVKSFVYKGYLNGQGKWYLLNYPGSAITNLYGPDNYKSGISVVGNYTNIDDNNTYGCLYQGPLDGTGKWSSLLPPFGNVKNVIAHSNMCGVVVGNYDTRLIQGKAFLYDIYENTYYDIVKKDAISITAYGIWYNGCDSYTICGGYKLKPNNDLENTEVGYLVDWDNCRKKLHNWRTYHYNNDPVKSRITHFDGITGNYKGDGYNLTGDWVGFDLNEPELGFFASVKRKGSKCSNNKDDKCGGGKNNKDDKCGGRKNRRKNNLAKWSSISYPGSDVTSGNTVYQKTVLGVYTVSDDPTVNGYISKVLN